jgi:GNAT superfamily N-acetyltransferase
MVQYRLVDWSRDLQALSRLDVSYVTETTYAVEAGPMSFTLVERAVDPPLSRRHDVDWNAVAAADHAVVAEDDGTVLGIIAAVRSVWNGRVLVSHLYVDATVRRRGVGAGLMGALQEWARSTAGARSLWVETQNVNAGAIRFYHRLGFVCCGLDTSLYDPRVCPGETAVYFSLALSPAASVPAKPDDAS